MTRPDFATGRPASGKPGPILATSTRGMVTSPHTLASEAGLKVLREGGDAIEAVMPSAGSSP